MSSVNKNRRRSMQWAAAMEDIVFGFLKVLKRIETPDGKKIGKAWFLCLCSCGNYHKTMGDSLRRGLVKSCGCQKMQLRALKIKELSRLCVYQSYNVI